MVVNQHCQHKMCGTGNLCSARLSKWARNLSLTYRRVKGTAVGIISSVPAPNYRTAHVGTGV